MPDVPGVRLFRLYDHLVVLLLLLVPVLFRARLAVAPLVRRVQRVLPRLLHCRPRPRRQRHGTTTAAEGGGGGGGGVAECEDREARRGGAPASRMVAIHLPISSAVGGRPWFSSNARISSSRIACAPPRAHPALVRPRRGGGPEPAPRSRLPPRSQTLDPEHAVPVAESGAQAPLRALRRALRRACAGAALASEAVAVGVARFENRPRIDTTHVAREGEHARAVARHLGAVVQARRDDAAGDELPQERRRRRAGGGASNRSL